MALISRASEYAIRAMTFMSSGEESRFFLVRDMSEKLGVPAPFLGKVLQQMVNGGMLASQRGRNGGFRLALPAAEISLYQIVDSQEALGKTRQCFLGQDECSDERACPMHAFWKATASEFLYNLVNTTLADMARFCEERPESGYPGQSIGIVGLTEK
ncbi:MAG: Rrf2 family transcriptional regulator [Planctomycetes bacterium]|nr:Rrf2 family transcriptional regulator [Planctomycetota bacterium]